MIKDYVTDLRRALQGPDALQLRYLPVFIVISFPVSIIVESSSIKNSAQLLDWTLVKSLSYVGLAIFYYFLRARFARRSNKTVRLLWLIVLSGLGGAIQGAITAFAIRKIGLVDVTAFWARPMSGFFLGLSWLPINAVFMNAFYSYSKQRNELHLRVNRLKQIKFNQSGLAAEIRDNIVQNISKQLNLSRIAAKEEFNKSLKSELASNISSSLLRDFASTNLRALSHQLWQQSEPHIENELEKSNNILEIYRLGLFLPPIDSLYFSLTSATLLMPVALRNAPLGYAIGLGTLFFLVSFFSMAMLSPIAKKFSSKSEFVYPARVALASGISLAVFEKTRNHFLPTIDHRNYLLGISALCIMSGIGLLISLAKSGLFDQSAVVDALVASAARQKLEIGLAEAEIALISRQWAQYIHGSLQAQLLAIAALLEHSSIKGDTKSREEAIEAAWTLLNSDFAVRDELNVRDLQQESEFRCHQWAGLVEVEVTCSITHDLPGIPVTRFGDAVEEAITNAVRHANATGITIDMRLNDVGDLECTFTDNGSGLSSDSVNGFGSAIFESITGGNWSRTNREDRPGTVLKLVIPASA